MIVPVEPWTPGSDSHGALTPAWGTPVAVEILGWGPSLMDQPIEDNRRPVLADVTVYARTLATGPRDRWTLPDGQFLQVGDPEDFGHGPWWAEAGYRVRLRKVTG